MTSQTRRQPDKLLCAHIAVNLAPQLSGNARRVAGAILAHWNSRTGQCDPSVERLAVMLGIDRATVLRATAELCTGEGRLFDKTSHGGKANRASYGPVWDAMSAIVADWNARMQTGSAPEKVAKVRRSRSHNCDVDGRKTATQTYRSNLPKELPAPTPEPAPIAKPRKPARKTASDPGQKWLLLPLPGGSPSRSQAADTAAQRRIMQTIRDESTDVFRVVCEHATPAMLDAATEAEVSKRGSGAPALLDALTAVRRAG